MESSGRLIRLSIVLCFVFYNVNAGPVLYGQEPVLYGGGLFDFNREVSEKLETLKRQKSEIENSLAGPVSVFEKWLLESSLKNVIKNIAQIEETSRVSYKDYLDLKAFNNGHFEEELKNLQAKLEDAKKKEISQEVESFQKQIDDLSNARDRIRKLYEEHVQTSKELEEKMTEEKKQLEKEKKEVMQVLETAKQRHSRALEVISAVPEGDHKIVELPEKNEIEGIKLIMALSIALNNKKQQIEGLKSARTQLQALIPALRKSSKLSDGTSRKDMEDALREMEKNTAELRQQQTKQRKEILDRLKNKGLTDFTDDEIASLEKVNEELRVTDSFEKEIAIRSAALKALLQVSDLIEECTSAVKDVKNGDLAKLWGDAFKRAKDQYQKLEHQLRSAFKH